MHSTTPILCASGDGKRADVWADDTTPLCGGCYLTIYPNLCPACHGEGDVVNYRGTGDRSPYADYCQACNGTGKAVRP